MDIQIPDPVIDITTTPRSESNGDEGNEIVGIIHICGRPLYRYVHTYAAHVELRRMNYRIIDMPTDSEYRYWDWENAEHETRQILEDRLCGLFQHLLDTVPEPVDPRTLHPSVTGKDDV
jgi:hypothetical protein